MPEYYLMIAIQYQWTGGIVETSTPGSLQGHQEEEEASWGLQRASASEILRIPKTQNGKSNKSQEMIMIQKCPKITSITFLVYFELEVGEGLMRSPEQLLGATRGICTKRKLHGVSRVSWAREVLGRLGISSFRNSQKIKKYGGS